MEFGILEIENVGSVTWNAHRDIRVSFLSYALSYCELRRFSLRTKSYTIGIEADGACHLYFLKKIFKKIERNVKMLIL